MMGLRWRARTLMFVFAILLCAGHAVCYSVLTHEELIDLAWNDSIRPFLLARFPNATEEQLKEAHAFAYGGCAIQDMGYYPFGKAFFSNLTHYVRTGDFIDWMFHHAHTIDEYAFAIGALSHYLGDTIGHSQAINPATAEEFANLKRKYGPSVTYGESPHGHIRTEFAFDVEELTNAEFAPPAYLRFIGFQVPRKFLEQAFLNTYGFDIHEIVGRAHPSLRSYRTSVRSFIPAFAEAEVVLHQHHFLPRPDDDQHRLLAERISRTSYDRRWKHTYKGPGVKAHLLAILVFIVPKIGPASDLAIKIPSAETDEWYVRSLNRTVDTFRRLLQQSNTAGSFPAIANLDLDTGDGVKRGDYPLADRTYDQLLERLTTQLERPIPASLKRNILEYYAEAGTAEPGEKVSKQLDLLKKMASAEAALVAPSLPVAED